MSVDLPQLAQFAESVAPWTVKAWVGQRIRTAKSMNALRLERVVTKRLLRAYHRQSILAQVDILSTLARTREYQISPEDARRLSECIRVRACSVGTTAALFALKGRAGYAAPEAWYVRFTKRSAVTVIGQAPSDRTPSVLPKEIKGVILEALRLGLYATEIRTDLSGNLHWSCLKHVGQTVGTDHARALTFAAVVRWARLGDDLAEGVMAHDAGALSKVESWLGDVRSITQQLATTTLR